MKKILNEFGDKWMIALQMDDGEFEHVIAKRHPFFLKLKRELLKKTEVEDAN
ncbi:hypothetical protein KAI04_04250 [Candidatus Pacearchaeota archaeon]|nr:hypothetical protein [Candidatus Pacearchaeota archaeon]